MVVIKRALALLLMTILIVMNATVAYGAEPEETDAANSAATESTAADSTLKAPERKKEQEKTEEEAGDGYDEVEEGSTKPSALASKGVALQVAATTGDTSTDAATEGDTSSDAATAGGTSTDASTDAATGGDTSSEVATEGDTSSGAATEGDTSSKVASEGDTPSDASSEADTSIDLASESKLGSKTSAFDVCFYIRGGCVGANIPSRSYYHSSRAYSDPIRVNGALPLSNMTLSSEQYDGSFADLLDDGFTAANDVTGRLSKLPTADEIKAVVPDFDPATQYVVWYVVKGALTGGSNKDVIVHVDGVIRQRPSAEEMLLDVVSDQETIPSQEDRDAALEELENQVQIVFVPLNRDENGNEVKELEFDGEEHIIGGFDIVILDDELEVVEEFVYNGFGKRLNIKVYAEGEDGKTSFEYKGEEFFVNLTAAYARVKDVGKAEIKYYSGQNEIDIEDVQITDRNGKVLSQGPSPLFAILGSTRYVTVKKPEELRSITITAGTKVMNNDGSTLTDGTFKVTGSLIQGHRIEKVVINGSQTGVGKCSNNVTSVVIVNSKGEDVTYLYNINKVAGKLELVDPNPDSGNGSVISQYTRTSFKGDDDNSGSKEEAYNDYDVDPAAAINGRVAKARITHTDGSVTYINVPFETGAGGAVLGTPTALGARRAATDDGSDPLYAYLTILICAAILVMTCARSSRGSFGQT